MKFFSKISHSQKPQLSQIRLKRFLRYKEKNSIKLFVLAAIVGVICGFLSIGFEMAVALVNEKREFLISQVHGYWFLSIPLAFIISMILAAIGYFLVRQFAPEAGGSGIPEIEGALNQLRPVRWWRVIPVKFIGGMGTLGAGMVLGREGPTVQLCGNAGRMVLDILGMKDTEARHTLISTGAAAGLSAAFNAPLAGILFIIEEMRPHFHYNLVSIKAIFIGVIMSSVVYRYFYGDASVINVGTLANAPVKTLWLYLVLGMLFGVVGIVFNRLIFMTQDYFQRIYANKMLRIITIGGIIGGCCGVLLLIEPSVAGGGFELIPLVVKGHYTAWVLFIIFIFRIITTLICFSSGAPGGIFAPMLALGTLLGTAFGLMMAYFFPQYGLDPGTFAISGMGALFAASVRAPLTGIVLVLEMTNNYQLILPMIITCLGATLLAQFLGGQPIYSTLLKKTLQKQMASAKTP